MYFKTIDTNRGLVGRFYRPGGSSRIIYNGTAMDGAAMAEFVSKLPASKHEVQCYDCHPLGAFGGGAAGASPSLALTVTGTVRYGDEHPPRAFHDTFVLAPDAAQPGTYFVASECFRQIA